MKRYVLLFLAIPLMALTCEDKRLETVGKISMNKVFTIDPASSFNESEVVSHGEILDMLDIPESARILDVKIEVVSIVINTLEGNTAESITVSGKIEESGQSPVLVFENESFSLGKVSLFGINSALMLGGTERIRKKLEGYLKMNDTNPFNIVVYGSTSPAGQNLHGTITLGITGAVKYETCESMPWFVEGDGPC